MKLYKKDWINAARSLEFWQNYWGGCVIVPRETMDAQYLLEHG